MKKNSDAAVAQSPDELLKELQALVAQAEQMVAGPSGDDSGHLLENLRDRFSSAQERFSEIYDGARKRVVAGAKYTDEAIRANPYQSLAVALGVGVLVGVLCSRCSRNSN